MSLFIREIEESLLKYRRKDEIGLFDREKEEKRPKGRDFSKRG